MFAVKQFRSKTSLFRGQLFAVKQLWNARALKVFAVKQFVKNIRVKVFVGKQKMKTL
jgi:hypothetical protein